MSIELPGEVVWFLNVIGAPWPNVDEDQVRLFGSHVRAFGANVRDTHSAASTTVDEMGQYYSGASYEQLVATWGRMSQAHMSELVEACDVVATALDLAADAIVAAKVVAIGELVAMAASFVADQAAAVATLGIAEAAEVAIVALAKKLVNGLITQLEQHILGEVIEKAVAPLEQVVARALGGLVFTGLEKELGAPAPADGAAAGAGFSIHPEQIRRHAAIMHGHADAVSQHATRLATAIAGVKFGE